MLRLPKGFLILLLSIILIFIFGISSGYLPSLKKGSVLLPPTDLPSPTLHFYPKEKVVKEIQTIAPWDHASDLISPEPVFPSMSQLDRIYQLLRKAVVERDKKTLVSYFSQERIWYLENPRRLGGETSQGQKVFLKDQNRDQDERTPELLYLTPELNQTEPVAIIKKSNDPGPLVPESFLFIDETTGISQTILDLPWRYVVEVKYKTKIGSKKPAEGKVIFIYDKNSWKYQGETWNFLSKEAVSFGKEPAEGTTTHEVRLVDKQLYPKELKVKIGDSVVWKNMTGVIYSYRPLSNSWNSPSLLNDNFIWTFGKKGTYSYRIAGVFSSEGVIYVE